MNKACFVPSGTKNQGLWAAVFKTTAMLGGASKNDTKFSYHYFLFLNPDLLGCFIVTFVFQSSDKLGSGVFPSLEGWVFEAVYSNILLIFYKSIFETIIMYRKELPYSKKQGISPLWPRSAFLRWFSGWGMLILMSQKKTVLVK